MIEIGFEEIRRRAPWPAEAGEKVDEGEEGKGGDEKDDGGKRADEQKGREARPETVRFQGMRVGYFCVDRDSGEERKGGLILNRIVGLKEDTGKD